MRIRRKLKQRNTSKALSCRVIFCRLLGCVGVIAIISNMVAFHSFTLEERSVRDVPSNNHHMNYENKKNMEPTSQPTYLTDAPVPVDNENKKNMEPTSQPTYLTDAPVPVDNENKKNMEPTSQPTYLTDAPIDRNNIHKT